MNIYQVIKCILANIVIYTMYIVVVFCSLKLISFKPNLIINAI